MEEATVLLEGPHSHGRVEESEERLLVPHLDPDVVSHQQRLLHPLASAGLAAAATAWLQRSQILGIVPPELIVNLGAVELEQLLVLDLFCLAWPGKQASDGSGVCLLVVIHLIGLGYQVCKNYSDVISYFKAFFTCDVSSFVEDGLQKQNLLAIQFFIRRSYIKYFHNLSVSPGCC